MKISRDNILLWCSGCQKFIIEKTYHPTGLNYIYCNRTGSKKKITIRTICNIPQKYKSLHN